VLESSLENVEETRFRIIFYYTTLYQPLFLDCWRLTSQNFTFFIPYITIQLLLLTPTNA